MLRPQIFRLFILLSVQGLLCISGPALADTTAAQTALKPESGQPQASCAWAAPPEIVEQGPSELHQIWEIENRPILWREQLPPSPSLNAFRAEVRARLPLLDPHTRWRRGLFAADSYNQIVAAAGRVGRLAPMNCLEALLLSQQTARLPMLQQPSEFGAFILRSPLDQKPERLKIYYSTQDRPGLRMNAQMMGRIERDRQAGWRVWSHLHNHNFFLSAQDPFASPSPSKTDVEFARRLQHSLGLEQMWVTNGFHTLHFNRRDFSLFRAHSDGGL